MKILVSCGDIWHPARIPQAGLETLDKSSFQFDWMTAVPAQELSDYPCIILTKSNHASEDNPAEWMTDSIQSALWDYVHAGGGLLAVHSGTASYENAHTLRKLLGGVFRHHPEQCPVTITPQTGHPLTIGTAPFTLKDEHYFMAFDDQQADVFLTTTSEHGQQPGAWTRTAGRGRIAVLTPGHNLEVWRHPTYQILLANMLQWCSGKQK